MRERLIPTGILVALISIGCTRANPAYIPLDGGFTGTGGGGGQDAGGDALNRSCTTPADCTAQLGAVPCTDGAWACQAGMCAAMCVTCTDNDKDGYGSGNCPADCDDNNASIGGQQACGSGDPLLAGMGVCRRGTQFCNGTQSNSTCGGEVIPGGEACNGEDDDCNGTPDDHNQLGTITCGLGACLKTVDACTNGIAGVCTPTAATATTDGCPADGIDNDCDGTVDDDCADPCLFVTPTGSDGGDGSIAAPFATIQKAITTAALTPGKRVCVASTACDAFTQFDAGGSDPIQMADGVSVYGNYDPTGARCPLTMLNVGIRARSPLGVLFLPAVTSPTTLDAVSIVMTSSGGEAVKAGITVDGAKQVKISNVRIDDMASGSATYGIDIKNGAEVTIMRSLVSGGAGTLEAIGIRSVGSKPTIRDNCSASNPATGGCAAACDRALGIHGRNGADSTGVSTAILLDSSPGAVVDGNTVCGSQAPDSAGVRIKGPAAAVMVRGNTIVASGAATQSHGVWMDACGTAKPRIGANELIQADGSAATTNISAVGVAGDCHPVIDSNARIVGGGETAGTTAVGVFCGAAANVASRCTILNNKIQGSSGTRPALARAVNCQQGACMRVARNVLSGNGGGEAVGIAILDSGPFVDRNDVAGGCGTTASYGVLSDDSYARLENNVIRGAVCTAGATSSTETSGVYANVASSRNEIDVHSNTIDGGGTGACMGASVSLNVRAGTTAPTGDGLRGVFRNNILRAGACNTRYGFRETDTGTSARLVENNDFEPTPTLYLSRKAASFSTPAMINSQGHNKGNISAPPGFVSAMDLHLTSNSACIDTGTPVGAPLRDIDGQLRDDGKPDIGAYEKK